MNDPLRDDRYPDRPQSDDFWRMSECALSVDADAASKEIPEIVGADVDALVYVARNRMGRVGLPVSAQTLALYVDAFTIGKRFAERGGSRPQN